jgi:uncharacterized protein
MMSDPDYLADYPVLVGEELVEELDRLLAVHPAGEDAPCLGYLDGALAGLLLSPDPIEPDEWLPKLQAGPDVQFPDPADGERFAAMLRLRQVEMAALMIEGGLAFMPIYDYDEKDNPLWQLWLAGFLGSMKLRMAAWEPLFEPDDEDLAAAVMGLMSLAAGLPGPADKLPEGDADALDEIAELADEAPMLLPYFVETIYRRRHRLARVVMGEGFVGEEDWALPQQPIRVEKIGRNEPCPCGSGKKYKKCCGR